MKNFGCLKGSFYAGKAAAYRRTMVPGGHHSKLEGGWRRKDLATHSGVGRLGLEFKWLNSWLTFMKESRGRTTNGIGENSRVGEERVYRD